MTSVVMYVYKVRYRVLHLPWQPHSKTSEALQALCVCASIYRLWIWDPLLCQPSSPELQTAISNRNSLCLAKQASRFSSMPFTRGCTWVPHTRLCPHITAASTEKHSWGTALDPPVSPVPAKNKIWASDSCSAPSVLSVLIRWLNGSFSP